ncbi:hypothetical protein MYCTH_2307047 [Thermothelomyces thermophilus ATCC 42464]|uniref:Uncharacterized protein n=1 Tax=Thermothelomyces thermophilus (strain ATCC 42464 / BCRC 31852 / DSM 1799) TaxID=573729 RepID=G2QF56_THET4|nr:uncharacterized protein MYCTH_2307047 [Thermothelomyces thermophilus ATCC 42464]AEO59085.1 hypothetical protein MYCTH_2307047 [Thermothelomyces thermophilus ATCC 42464]
MLARSGLPGRHTEGSLLLRGRVLEISLSEERWRSVAESSELEPNEFESEESESESEASSEPDVSESIESGLW